MTTKESRAVTVSDSTYGSPFSPFSPSLPRGPVSPCQRITTYCKLTASLANIAASI